MAIVIKEVETPQEIKAFVNFQFKLYKKEKMWVPPMKMDEISSISADKNPAFGFCDTKFWMAYKNDEIVGRIGVIINRRENRDVEKKVARFTRIEFINDLAVCKELLDCAELWAKFMGCEIIHGPLGFANLDHSAVLIEGHEHLPSVASEWHMPYYNELIEKCGYIKEMDWVEFRLTLPDVIPEKVVKIAELVKQKMGVTVRSFNNSKEMMPYADEMFNLLNVAFADLFGFVHLDEKMRAFYIKKYVPILSAKFIKLVFDKEGVMIGFIIGLPSLSKAMQKAKGRLLPFGWWHIMQAYKHCDTIDLLLTGMDPRLQGHGYAAILMVEMLDTAKKNGARWAETTGMIETNVKAIQNWKSYEHIQHKRKRCYIKEI
jgi:GNAT superfamily N-acetyltransferase